MQERIEVLAAAILAAAIAGGTARAEPDEPSRDLAAGGLVYLNDSSIVTDLQELTVGASVRWTYVLRNTSNGARTVLIAFPLPDLDVNALGEQVSALPASSAANFLDAAVVADGKPVTLVVEQRASVLGLDATRHLEQAGVPLNPTAKGVADILQRLPPQVRSELQSRGIVRTEDRRPTPAWLLKTTAYWLQSFAPRQTTRVELTYKPVEARARYTPALLDQLRSQNCLDGAGEADLTRRVAATAGNIGFRWLSVSLTSGSHLVQAVPVPEFRLLIEKPSIESILATCRKGLRRLGPTAFEWTATSYVPDEDLSVLFIE